ncbi:MAG: winged helix-turn-helix transcriptional regulator [Promethearchaeota archaeon]
MSLERKKETKGTAKEETLQESKFRRLDFTPLKEDVEEEKREIPPQIDELTEIERDVLKIAKNILKLKRYDADFNLEIETEAELQRFPIIEKLYAKCIAKLAYKKGYSKEDIFLAIRSLEDKTWIVTNERRTKLEILNNEKLVSILKFIESNPGIHARDEKVEEELDITRTPFLKHIMTLERFNLIRSKKIGKSLHYFRVDVPEDFDELKVIFINPLIINILEEIVKDESISISRIGEILDVYSGTVQYHLKKMKELDLVKSSKDQKGQVIHIVNIELLKNYNNIFKEPDFSKLLNGL